MWTLGIVEAQILSDAGADIGNVAVGVHVDHLIFYRSPQTLSREVPLPSMEMAMVAFFSTLIKSMNVNWLPWSTARQGIAKQCPERVC